MLTQEEMLSQFAVRRSTPDDYEALALICRLSVRNSSTTASELEFADKTQEQRCYLQRFIVEMGGYPAGSVTAYQPSDMYHPRKFWVRVRVVPEYRDHGIGAALYQAALADLKPFDPASLFTVVNEADAGAVHFAGSRGYVEVMREWESSLDVPSVDLSKFQDQTDRLTADGIEIRALSELTADPLWEIKLHDLDVTASADCPTEDEYTPLSLESFRAQVLGFPTFDPASYFVATHMERYVGLSSLWRRGTDENLDTGFTGVRREYRKRGVGMALKLAAVRYAQQQGYKKIHTWNAVHNRSMLAINEALGFIKEPADISMRLDIRKESST